VNAVPVDPRAGESDRNQRPARFQKRRGQLPHGRDPERADRHRDSPKVDRLRLAALILFLHVHVNSPADDNFCTGLNISRKGSEMS
jgi:hypothetical protein